MAEYNYVYWGAKTPITDVKLLQMSENDQYNYDVSTSAAQGIIGWMETESDFVMTGAIDVDQIVNSFTMTKTISVDRMLKLHYHASVMQGSATSSSRVQVKIKIDGSMVGSRELDVEKNYKRSIDDVECIVGVGAGSHTFTVEARRVSGTGTPSLSAHTDQPMQFWIEDIGSFVAKDS